ncbi:MAG: SAM-dependent methyltransferase [Ferruginibacter sp.]
MTKLDTLLKAVRSSVENNTLLRITLGNKRDKAADLKNVYIKPAMIKDKLMLSFVYRYPTKDITKNFLLSDALSEIRSSLVKVFFNADIYTVSQTLYFSADAAGKEMLVTKPAASAAPVLTHDKEKKRLLNSSAIWLRELGITGAEGNIKKEKQHKFKQINRYVEIIEGILQDVKMDDPFTVNDMGSGKGYLTFALYDHLTAKNIPAQVTGIELRKDLVDSCNRIAEKSGYAGLCFVEGSISDTAIDKVDMLIALHACDTATDDAIAKGIRAGAAIIICAPCCHKQVRRQMKPANALQDITKHGILLERQAEMVTDTIRALMLEAHGYKTKVFEFIEEEHTPKNVLIVGTKSMSAENVRDLNFEKIKALKEMFGIKEHYIETVL